MPKGEENAIGERQPEGTRRENQLEREPGERHGPASAPAIRTLRSDIARFLKSDKAPSIASIIASREALAKPAAPSGRRTKLWLLASIGFGIGLVALSAGIISYRRGGETRAPVSRAPEISHPPLIFFESQAERTIALDPAELSAWLEAGTRRPGATGMLRLVTLVREAGGRAHPLAPAELFALIGVSPPAGFGASLGVRVEFFTAFETNGPRLGMLVETQNPARTFEGLLIWEPSLTRDLELLFGGRTPPPSFGPFQDKTYRNVDFRYLVLDPAEDLGIGYLVFPGKKLLAIATSESSLHTIIDRLFQAR